MNKPKSFYRKHIEDYIAFRVSNNFKRESFLGLYDFDAFLYDNDYQSNELTKEIIDKWDERRPTESKVGQHYRIRTVRQFCRYLNACGVTAHVSTNFVKAEKNMPFIFEREDLPNYFQCVDEFCMTLRTAHYRYMVPVILKLIYTSGLRVGEAVRIETHDLDLEKQRIYIRDSKNLKSRYAYISISTVDLLSRYINRLKKEKFNSIWLFPNSRNSNHILNCSVDDYFNDIVNYIGIYDEDHHPVPHSLRHSFTVHIMDKWVRDGYSLNELMPYLENQLGHQNLNCTLYYYHMIYESYDTILTKTRDIYPEVNYYEEED